MWRKRMTDKIGSRYDHNKLLPDSQQHARRFIDRLGYVHLLGHSVLGRVGLSFAASRCLGFASSRGPFLAIFGVTIVRNDMRVSATELHCGVN
jgi:hypothetical protein